LHKSKGGESSDGKITPEGTGDPAKLQLIDGFRVSLLQNFLIKKSELDFFFEFSVRNFTQRVARAPISNRS